MGSRAWPKRSPHRTASLIIFRKRVSCPISQLATAQIKGRQRDKGKNVIKVVVIELWVGSKWHDLNKPDQHDRCHPPHGFE